MLSMIKDLPFIDTVFPIVIAVAIWTGVHVLFIGPEVIGPRLTEKYYMPACRAGVARIKALSEEKQQRAYQAQRRQQEVKKRKAGKLLDGLTTSIFGPEFAEYYKDHPFIKSMQDMARMGIELETPTIILPKPSQMPSNYCNCIIAELLSERMATGLYSASLRLWKGNNIRRLQRLNKELPNSSTCGNPAK